MRTFVLIITSFFILKSCCQNKKEVVLFSTTFGNSLHGSITLEFDNLSKFLILKRVGSKDVVVPPPPPAGNYSKIQRDSISKVQKQYYIDYAQPKTMVYKLSKEESKALIELINIIPKEERGDFYPEYPMGDGFMYNFQIIYSDGNIEDVEIQHLNVSSHEKLIFQMLSYAKKYERDKNNIQVLKNFKNWNHPKY
ncbi:hypothetical protein BAX95_07020 [Elizabethkingia meningoseptica]|uniref:hypothetical protein n=1 Tax=Elizabethkingia meningoseptica TaxID=238 RepID=UPI0008418F15|nr:hypothetical protein [Elizabethkingia meningoseptica]ODM52734.1 hypothetical protein BES09_13990 [Elizabethkingia meningoseptica]OHT27644.1 hypothetical protein BFF93_13995 [Elizabethkingia meningoseptica]OPC09080.1 hypothetical protein BAX93_12155 [Elizabethkingia meningoseptica]OPC23621.1 hypothetical protein BAX95_07020 [Elizabethkingia meningoseptica]